MCSGHLMTPKGFWMWLFGTQWGRSLLTSCVEASAAYLLSWRGEAGLAHAARHWVHGRL